MSDTTPKTWNPETDQATKQSRPKDEPAPLEGTLPADLAQLSQNDLETLLQEVEDDLRRAELKAGDSSTIATYFKTGGLACIVGLFTLSGTPLAADPCTMGIIGIIGLIFFTIGSYCIRPHAKKILVTARTHDRDRVLRAIDQTSSTHNAGSNRYRL